VGHCGQRAYGGVTASRLDPADFCLSKAYTLSKLGLSYSGFAAAQHQFTGQTVSLIKGHHLRYSGRSLGVCLGLDFFEKIAELVAHRYLLRHDYGVYPIKRQAVSY